MEWMNLIYQPWPKPSPEFVEAQRRTQEALAERINAMYRPIEEAPRDGTEVMVSDRPWMVFAWRAKWDAEQECWLRGCGADWFRVMGEPKFWMPKIPLHDPAPINIYATKNRCIDLTAGA